MAEFTANAVQLVQANQNILFTDTIDACCPLIYHRDGSGSIKLFPKNNQCYTKFYVAFSGNVAIPAGVTAAELTFALTVDGEPVPTTTMRATPGNNGSWNIATFVYLPVKRPCCSTIGVRNIGTIPTNIQNANLIVEVA